MVTPEITGPRQAKRRATEAIAEIVSNSKVVEKITTTTTNIKSKRPRINSTKSSISSSQGKKSKSASSASRKHMDDDDDSMHDIVVEYSWPVEPLPYRVGKHVSYNQIRMSLTSHKWKRVFHVRHGGSIRLMTKHGKPMFCRVDRFISNRNNERDVKVEGKWLLSRKDLIKHFGSTVTPECQEYMDQLQHNDLVLTNTSCVLEVAGIEGNIRLLYRQPNQLAPADPPANTYMCRFTLDIDTTRRTLEWGVIDSLTLEESSLHDVDDELMEENVPEDLEEPSSSPVDSDNDTDTSSSIEDVSRVEIREGGSAILRTEIRVGPKFQVDIQPFNVVPFIQSRKPMLVHKANSIPDDKLLQFLNSVAVIHNKYLAQNKIAMEEPYTPLSQSRMEQFISETPTLDRLTGSCVSTASMLAGKRCQLMKECDSDALLEILAFHNYDTKRALEAIEGDLNRITAGWTRAEKDIFDDAFRRNNGSLRKVSKAIAPTKNVKDVIDYFFRFKVSDQFRKFQDKKRAMAVRIVDCIETKKYCESLTPTSNVGTIDTAISAEDCEGADKPSHWSESSASSMAVARDDRIHSAKRLLLDVKDRLGSKRMAEVASVIRQLQACYEPNGRSFLFKLLDGQPELQRRFLEFLPRHF